MTISGVGMLKKALISLFALLVTGGALLLGATFIHGQYYLNLQHQQLVRMTDSVNAELRLASKHFSLFGSEHRYHLQMPEEEQATPVASSPLEFVNSAVYWPHKVEITTELVAPAAWQSQLDNERLPIKAITEVNFLGEINGEVTMDNWLIEDPMLGVVQFQPALMSYQGGAEALLLDLNWDGFSINGLAGEARLAGLRLEVDAVPLGGGFYTGSSNLFITSFDASDDTMQLSLKEFAVENGLTEQADRLEQRINLGWQAISINPGMGLYHSAQSHLKMSVSGLDKGAWMNAKNASQQAELSAEDAQQLLLALLQKGLAIDINALKLNLQDANLTAQLHLKLPPNQLTEFSQLPLLKEELTGDGKLVVDHRLLQLLPIPPDFIQQMVALGYIGFDETTEQYRTEAELQQGQLQLNGQALPL
ncbi:DUF945 family protein [Corallincola holothuriorum]|uniref:DUF945 family protein n=2 Tax=Corallincola holothuriorum TaxID=2282215 RepID=A0A368NND3_9GAMM|nr:DUF945 family protein [Corallincola holothuriorum]